MVHFEFTRIEPRGSTTRYVLYLALRANKKRSSSFAPGKRTPPSATIFFILRTYRYSTTHFEFARIEPLWLNYSARPAPHPTGRAKNARSNSLPTNLVHLRPPLFSISYCQRIFFKLAYDALVTQYPVNE